VATDDYIVAACSDMDVHISTDDGENWVNQELAPTPRSTPYIMAADGDWIICGEPLGLHFNGQSTDGGQSWAEYDSVPRPIVSAAIRDSIALVETPNGLFRSVNYGLTWNKVHTISTEDYDPQPIAFSKNKVFIGVARLYDKGHILSSSDNGATWPETTYLSCHFINAIIGSPAEADSQFIFAATDSGVFRSPAEGQSWIKKSNGLNSYVIFSLAFKIQGTEGKSILFAGTGNGIFSSSDYGNNWTEVGSPAEWAFTTSGSTVYAISSNDIYTGYTKYFHTENDLQKRNVVCLSINHGSSWTETYAGSFDHDPTITSFVCTSDDILFVGGKWQNQLSGHSGSIVLVSDDHGSEWSTVYIDSSTSTPVLAAHTSDVFMSTFGDSGGISHFIDHGTNWEMLNNNLIMPIPKLAISITPDISTFSFDGSNIYIAGGSISFCPRTRPPKLFIYNFIYTSENGINWSRIESPLDSIKIINDRETDTLSIISNILPDGSHIMVGLNAINFSGWPWTPANGGGFYHLYYDGSKWTLADTAFTNQSVFGFAAHGSTIFAATENGIFSTDDYGANWNDLGIGMGTNCVHDLIVTDAYLLAATYNGVWKRPIAEITSMYRKETNESLQQNFSLSQNYPNPFNPNTTIEFTLPKTEFVTMKVFNVLGQQVATLVSEKLNAGDHKYEWQAEGLPSGIYYCRMQSGEFEQVRKIILLK
jgi:photosystem II stability/assembly factor-like uncharacterized protein